MVDLRSDTLTMPDYPMLETILTARLGDDGRTDAKGRGEDPTINRLEDMAAALVGKEAAILMPTGTFGNTIAVMTHCHAGQTVLVDEEQHMLLTEKFAFEQDLGRLTPARALSVWKTAITSPAATASTCPRWRLSARWPTDTASPSTWTVHGSSTQRPICTPR